MAPVVAEHVGPMPYPALNGAFDALVPPGLQHYWKANFVKELTDEAIDGAPRARPEGPGGELDDAHLPDQRRLPPRRARRDRLRVPRRELRDRDRRACGPTRPRTTANIAWVRDYYDATAPHSEEGGYVNFMAERRPGPDQGELQGNYDRLVEVKRAYDPDNLFHLNQNIKP